MGLRSNALAAAVCILLFAGSTLVTLLARQALAAPCPDPNNGFQPYNTPYKPGSNSRGVKVVTGAVYNVTIVCGRVSSLIIRNASNEDYVEIGWYEMPSQGKYVCLSSTGGDDKPHILAFELNSTGFSCAHNTAAVTGGQNDSFSVHDNNQDGYWTFTYAGSPVFTGAENMGLFQSGITDNNGERLNFDDVAKAEFTGLQRMDGSQTWINWGNTVLDTSVDDDPGFKGCFYSNTHTGVVANANSC